MDTRKEKKRKDTLKAINVKKLQTIKSDTLTSIQ